MVTRRPWMMEKRCGHHIVGVAGGSVPWSWLARMRYRRLCRRRCGMFHAGGEAGFTLVEVIVALAMLSAGLILVLGLISSSIGRAASAERMVEAGLMARSLLAEVGTYLPIRSEDLKGKYSNGYRWHLKMRPYGDVEKRDEAPVELYTISTEVEWGEGGERRAYTITTLRLGPRVARP